MVGEQWEKDDVEDADDGEEVSEKTELASDPLLAEESESWDRCRLGDSTWGRIIGDTGAGSGENAGTYSGTPKLGA